MVQRTHYSRNNVRSAPSLAHTHTYHNNSNFTHLPTITNDTLNIENAFSFNNLLVAQMLVFKRKIRQYIERNQMEEHIFNKFFYLIYTNLSIACERNERDILIYTQHSSINSAMKFPHVLFFFLFSLRNITFEPILVFFFFFETFTSQFHSIYCNWIDCTETLIGTFRTENALMHRKIMVFFSL